MSNDTTSTCPLCGRLILPKQEQCACGTVLRGMAAAGTEATGPSKFDYGQLLPWIPYAGAALLFIWLFAPPVMLHYSIMPLVKVYCVVVILSSMLALLAADRMKKMDWAYADSPLAQWTPQSWFGSLVLLWPVMMPVFLRVHYERMDPKRVTTGYIGVGLFMLLLLAVLIFGRSTPPEWTDTPPAEPPPSPSPVIGQLQPAPAANPAPTAAVQPAAASPSSGSPVQSPASPPTQPASPAPATISPIPQVVPPVQPAAPGNSSSTNSPSAPAYGINILPGGAS